MILAPGVGSRVPFFMALDWLFGSRFHFLRFCFVEISFDLLVFSSYWLSIMWFRCEIGWGMGDFARYRI